MLHFREFFVLSLVLAFAAPGLASAQSVAGGIQSAPAGESGMADRPRLVGADELLALIQSERRAAGVAQLLAYDPLNEVAAAHARDMASRGYLADVTPEGLSLLDRLRRNDRQTLYSAFGVNIARLGATAAASDVHAAIMSSPEHAGNVLRDRFGHVGVAAVVVAGQVYIVQAFARVEGQLGRPLPELAAADFALDLVSVADGMAPVSWSITSADGIPLRQGRGQRLRPADLTGVEGYLSVDVAKGADIYRFKGPYLKTN